MAEEVEGAEGVAFLGEGGFGGGVGEFALGGDDVEAGVAGLGQRAAVAGLAVLQGDEGDGLEFLAGVADLFVLAEAECEASVGEVEAGGAVGGGDDAGDALRHAQLHDDGENRLVAELRHILRSERECHLPEIQVGGVELIGGVHYFVIG